MSETFTQLPVSPWLCLSLFITDYRPGFFIRKSSPKKANGQGCYRKCIENKKTRARDRWWGGAGSLHLFVTSLTSGMNRLSRIFHWSGTKGSLEWKKCRDFAVLFSLPLVYLFSNTWICCINTQSKRALPGRSQNKDPALEIKSQRPAVFLPTSGTISTSSFLLVFSKGPVT